MESAIDVRGLTRTYPGGVTAVKDLDLSVPVGSIFGFLGANGAGKTTTLRVVAGLAKPTSGSVAVMGVPLSAGHRYRRNVAFLGQEPRFYDWMTARQTLRYAAGFYRDGARSDEAHIESLLELVGIADAADRRTSQFSGGMRQRLGIAQALVGRPAVVLLDEPVSALDPVGRKDVLDLMESLRGTTTVLYSTHILDDVERVADHVAILDHGRLVTSAPTARLLADASEASLRVELAGDVGDALVGLEALPGVRSVRFGEITAGSDRRVFELHTDRPDIPAVQLAVTRFAADAGLALLENRPAAVNLETIFLNLIDSRERAA